MHVCILANFSRHRKYVLGSELFIYSRAGLGAGVGRAGWWVNKWPGHVRGVEWDPLLHKWEGHVMSVPSRSGLHKCPGYGRSRPLGSPLHKWGMSEEGVSGDEVSIQIFPDTFIVLCSDI
jgi:hypothetical protein